MHIELRIRLRGHFLKEGQPLTQPAYIPPPLGDEVAWQEKVERVEGKPLQAPRR